MRRPREGSDDDEPPVLDDSPVLAQQRRQLPRGGSKTSRQGSELNFQTEWWMEAVENMLEKQLADQAEQLRRAVAEEVEAALKIWDGRAGQATPRLAGVRSSRPRRAHEEGRVVQGGQGRGTEDAEAGKSVDMSRSGCSGHSIHRSESVQTAQGEHLANLVDSAGSEYLRSFARVLSEKSNGTSRGDHLKAAKMAVQHRGERLRAWLRGLEEPPRVGRLARFVDGTVLEAIVCLMIGLNFAFMVHTANVEIQNPGETDRWVLIGSWAFHAFYTIEIFVKLVVHRQWFFVAEDWKMNICDFTLMVSGFIIMSAGSGSEGSILRTLRFLKFGKSLRALRVMSHVKPLRSLLLCLEGSFMHLFWTVVLLFVVYLIFSLFLMQVIIGHLQATGEPLHESVFDDNFGSVQSSVLTLYKATTGGDDWSIAYDEVQVAGGLGTGIYLLFIVFVQFALMNIITSIFVESAMVTLSPDSEMLAREHARQAQENAKKLEQLCKDVDSDLSGKLTQEQFEDGLRQKHIPMLLSMLGLQRHHVLEFFAQMADAADDGQVEISKFVSGCMLLKGAATNFDLHQLHAELHQLHAEVQAQRAHSDESPNEMSQLVCEDSWDLSLPPSHQGS